MSELLNNKILEKMHPLHLMIADEFIRICDKHGLKTFMVAGTQLGAIRHKGFIPWDDDMDFGMKRKDFERFLECASADLNTEIFELIHDRNTKYFAGNYAKLMLKKTRMIESSSKDVHFQQGIFIDIFPFDAISDNKVNAFLQLKSFWIFRNLLWVKCGYGDENRRKRLSYKATKLMASLFSVDFLKKMKYKSITKYVDYETEKSVISDGTYGLKKETIRTEWISNIAYYNFEDRWYPGMKDYQAYLSYFYGDYMKLPPENRRNHHGRLQVDFGPYV